MTWEVGVVDIDDLGDMGYGSLLLLLLLLWDMAVINDMGGVGILVLLACGGGCTGFCNNNFIQLTAHKIVSKYMIHDKSPNQLTCHFTGISVHIGASEEEVTMVVVEGHTGCIWEYFVSLYMVPIKIYDFILLKL